MNKLSSPMLKRLCQSMYILSLFVAFNCHLILSCLSPPLMYVLPLLLHLV